MNSETRAELLTPAERIAFKNKEAISDLFMATGDQTKSTLCKFLFDMQSLYMKTAIAENHTDTYVSEQAFNFELLYELVDKLEDPS